MDAAIWLINLYGVPCTPSAFNPDNSLAVLAGALKDGGFFPEILDFQNIDFSSQFVSRPIGNEIYSLVEETRGRKMNSLEIERFSTLNKDLVRFQLGVLEELAMSLTFKARQEQPLFIGFKLYSGEGSFFSRFLASKIKSELEIPLVGGGPLIRVVGKKFLELYGEFDYLLCGEADRSIVALAKYLQGKHTLDSVKGLAYRRATSVCQNSEDLILSLDDLPEPVYDRSCYPVIHEPGKKALVFQIDESRGCANSCSFCVHPIVNGHKYRMVSPNKVVSRIGELQNQFGAYAFRFTGSNTPKKFLREFANQVKQQNLDIKYSCYSSVNSTDGSDLNILKQSGLAGVFVGVETMDHDILLNVFNKRGQSREKVEHLLRSYLHAGIYTTTSWIYPMPFATNTIRNEMRDFILSVYNGRSLDEGSVMLVPSGLLPNTEWFLDRDKFGFKVSDIDDFYRGYIELNMRFWLPRNLMGQWAFTLHDRSFLELATECDDLVNELLAHSIPMGITDDWMLQGKLSGFSMADYKRLVTKAFLTGDYSEIGPILCKINGSSERGAWAS